MFSDYCDVLDLCTGKSIPLNYAASFLIVRQNIQMKDRGCQTHYTVPGRSVSYFRLEIPDRIRRRDLGCVMNTSTDGKWIQPFGQTILVLSINIQNIHSKHLLISYLMLFSPLFFLRLQNFLLFFLLHNIVLFYQNFLHLNILKV